MKSVKRFLLIILLFISFLTTFGCTKEETIVNNLNEKINLNIHNADLIANVTDNVKYFNQDLLYDLDGLEDSDKINIIVTLDETGLSDDYNNNHQGYRTLSEYANSKKVSSRVSSMTREQQKVSNELLDANLINSVNHSYTTLFNGFSATTTYGKFKKIVSAGNDFDVTISEVYSKPQYEVTSSNNSLGDEYKAVTNFVNVYETGIFDSSNVGYDGSNTAVAILDSGFDIHHTVFKNMPSETMIDIEDVEDIFYETKAYGYHQNMKVQDVYLNEKIPFVYDYADKDSDVAPYDSNHGTHVAGIIGGKDDVITGVAINTQLVLMKVFGDINNGAIQDDILAALEDAILLGVDAINLSLGSACGFSRSADDERINEVYDKIETAGISLVVAASNDYSSGYGGENSNTNKASNPDSATVGSPGTYPSTIAVASISGVKSRYMNDDTGYTFFFNNANNSAGKPYDFYEMLFDKLEVKGDTLEIEYVTVPGVGKKINYSSIDVEGKVALVRRGETSFEEKAQVALSQGAIGCIIYNNIAGDVFMNAGSKLELALCSISKDDGEYLAAKSSGKLVLNKNNLAGPFMSEFSSWGPVSDLSLKPEITAHGGSITSSVPGGGYEEISGTSMACPNLCGVIILVKQALKERYEDLSRAELTNLANSLLMSTATIVLDEQGNPYSPRKQGSGLGNLEYAVNTLAYLSVENQTKPKLELKDDKDETGVYTLKFDVNNVSDQDLKYRLSNLTMTESLSTADPEYVAEKAYMLNPKTNASISGDGSLDGDVVTIYPNSKATITYTLTLNEDEIEYIRRSFINGIYVEGFAVLESLNEDNIDLSIPFLAFFGDWTKAPMFDKTYFEVESEKYKGSIDEEDKLKADYYATTPLGTYYYSYIIPLGSYVYEMDETMYDKIPATEEHCAIGYNLETINGITTVYAGLLRNAKKMTTVIKNAETGEIVYEHLKYDEHKAYFSGQIVPGYDIINVTALDLGLQNNTKYTFEMKAYLDYEDGGEANNLNNTFSFSFYVDYQAPIVTDAEFYSKYDKSLKDYRYYVDVFVYDNHYAQSIRPFTIVDGNLVSLSEYVIPIYGSKADISKVTIEITDYMDLLQYGVLEDGTFSISNGLGFLVDDYALNQSYSFVTLPGTNTSNITYKEEYASFVSKGTYRYNKKLYVGDELDLSVMLTSDDVLDEDETVQAAYFASLDWASDNENIVKVKNGKIEAVGSGTAIITCTTMASDGYAYELHLRITVNDKEVETTNQKLTDINFTYFNTLKAFIDGPEISEIGEVGDRFFFTEKHIISCYPSEQVQLGYELEPWNLKDYELIWSSTNEKVATVDENGVVTALKEGSATITLKVKVGGKTQTLMASAKVNVKSEFVIEGNTLVAYKGLGGNVVIPDDEGILYIGSFAFSLYTTDYEIKIEEDDYDAAKTPSSNDSVKSVTIPSDILEVQKYAFYNCTALEKVTFLKNEKGDSCPYIKDFAFAKNENLTTINLDDVEIIGANAFNGCKKLSEVNLTSAYAIGRRAFSGCSSLTNVDITALRNAGEELFLNCHNLTTITTGQYTNYAKAMFKNTSLINLDFYSDRIPDNCFDNCESLKSVVIHNNLVYVGANAFNNCKNLETVTFNKGAECQFIYNNAFNNCQKLTTVTLPDSSFSVEEEIFNNCSSLKEIIFGENTYISSSLQKVFNGCNNLETFTLNDNKYYSVSDNLLLSKDEKTIILAAHKYDYTNYQIPEKITTIFDGAFSSIDSLVNLTILSTVTSVDNYAFAGCKNLTTVTLEDSNLSIGDYAFSDCVNLKEVTNLENLSVINKYTFKNTGFETLELNGEIKEGAFSGSKKLTNVVINSSNELGDSAFLNCSSLINAKVSAIEIGENAFSGCVKLSNIEMNNTTVIASGAFKGNIALLSVSLDNVLTIGDYAFSDCRTLSSINLPKVKTIGSYAFGTTNNDPANIIKEINLPNTLTVIGDYAFYGSTDLLKVTIGSGIKEIGAFAFANCHMLNTVEIDNVVEILKECAFADCQVLENFTSKGIKVIEGGVFLNNVLLTSIDLSETLEIGMQAFYNCTNLTKVNLDSVIKLDDGAFLNANNLSEISMKKIEYIGFQALSCINVSTIVLPNTITYISAAAFANNQNLTYFTDENLNITSKLNDYIFLDDGVIYTVTANNYYVLNTYPTGKVDATYEVLFNTIRIEEYAGYFNQNLKTLILPDTLKFIGNDSFYGCKKLSTVEFKSTVAPVLEGTVGDINIEYDTSSEIYKLLNKYFQFNGYYPLFYRQFKDSIGLCDKLDIIIPQNADVKSYEDILYSLYFDLENKKVSEYVALNTKSIDYLNKVALIKDEVTLSDGVTIQNARTAYNILDQDLTKYGYSKDYLDGLYQKLINAETKWNEINSARINKVYSHLIEDIKNLGSTYDFNKIKDYYDIVKALEIVDRNDKKYIDTKNVDNFKTGFDEYFKDLNEDVNTLTDVTTLPTTTVNKVGLVVLSTVSLTSGLFLIVLFIKKRVLR